MTKPKHLGGLGFRDLEIFNLALLLKQAWRLLQNPTSLSARILKGVYFPDVSLFEATLGNHPSQIWRAILDGRDIMVQGLVRRIGNGETTNIWRDNWLPRTHMKRPLTSLIQHPPHKVSELINTATCSWNEQLVRATFVPIDAESIMKIPLCTRQVEDFWAWSEDRRGIFSVRSAYHMIHQKKLSRDAWLYEQGGSSHTQANNEIWTKLWGFNIPSKLKMFLWRFVKNTTPTGALLHHRNIAETPACGLCGAKDTWRHALLNYMVSRSTWALSSENIIDALSKNEEGDAKSWLSVMREVLPQESFTTLVVALWALWGARRKAIYEQIYQSPFQVHGFIQSYMRELQAIKTVKARQGGNSVPRPISWIPPPSGLTKLNVDAAVGRGSGHGSVAAISRNSDGLFRERRRWFLQVFPIRPRLSAWRSGRRWPWQTT